MTHSPVMDRVSSAHPISVGDPGNELHYVTRRRKASVAAVALCGYTAHFTPPGVAGGAGYTRKVCATCAVLYNALPA